MPYQIIQHVTKFKICNNFNHLQWKQLTVATQIGPPNISNKTEKKQTEHYLVRHIASAVEPQAQALSLP